MVARVAAAAAASIKLFGGHGEESNIPGAVRKQFVDHLQGVCSVSRGMRREGGGDVVAYLLLVPMSRPKPLCAQFTRVNKFGRSIATTHVALMPALR